MAGLFQVKELEARRRALAAESEVYRETLEQELRNLGSVALSARQRFARVRTFNPLFILGMPAAGFVFRRMFDRKKESAEEIPNVADHFDTYFRLETLSETGACLAGFVKPGRENEASPNG